MNQDQITELLRADENAAYIFKEILTLDEAARYMGITKNHLYKLTMYRKIPHYKPGGKMCYFRRADLDGWMTSNRVATAEELADRADRILMRLKPLKH